MSPTVTGPTSLLRWGDPLFPDSPAVRSAQAERRRAIEAVRLQQRLHRLLPIDGTSRSRHALRQSRIHQRRGDVPRLEGRQDTTGFKDMTAELVDIEMAAHGVTIVEIARDGDGVAGRCATAAITAASARSHEMTVDGPAAGHDRLKTSADPSGNRILGTLNNCAGGMTPWGTYLTAEENFHGYFWTDHCSHEAASRQGVWAASRPRAMSATACPGMWQAWGKFHRPLQCRQGAERAEPLRLDRRDRSVRSPIPCR